MIGKSLLHYRVTEKIGAGGMGVVYRATDTKLHRDVAIKVLPEAFSKDKERLTRFEREARVLASLNHPNLAAIYGLEQSGGVHFLVLELIPGVTLAERIAAGAIGLEEALSLFSQIADAVEAAHSKGVIHRDLKPANIKITPEGKIIVLDFGLAKPFETEPMQDLSQSPTLTRNETATGVILGTASYMSPEQARRKGVDKRTDTWAFGCVLFEALSGRVAFPGETLSDTLANVLAREPLWEKLPETTPVSIRRLLRRCLQKDPERRLRDMGDARLDIEDARDGAAEDVSAPTPKPVARWRTTIPWLVTGLVVALWVFAPKATPPVIRSSLVLPPTQQLHGVAISPDGSRIVYAAGDRDSQELFLRHLSEEASAPIPGTENAVGPFFSPDGQWVGFFADNELRKVRLDGVGAVVLAEATSATSIKTGSWGLDGTIVFLQESGFMKISDGGGTPESLTTIDSDNGEVAHASARVLPGGEALLFAVTGDGINANIVVQSLETGERRFPRRRVCTQIRSHWASRLRGPKRDFVRCPIRSRANGAIGKWRPRPDWNRGLRLRHLRGWNPHLPAERSDGSAPGPRGSRGTSRAPRGSALALPVASVFARRPKDRGDRKDGRRQDSSLRARGRTAQCPHRAVRRPQRKVLDSWLFAGDLAAGWNRGRD